MKKTIKISALITALFLSASVWAADWNSTAVYVGGDTVSYQGKTYTAKWWTTGEAPGASQWGPWQLITSGGGATPAPTTAPTAKPITAPTVAPTVALFVALVVGTALGLDTSPATPVA